MGSGNRDETTAMFNGRSLGSTAMRRGYALLAPTIGATALEPAEIEQTRIGPKTRRHCRHGLAEDDRIGSGQGRWQIVDHAIHEPFQMRLREDAVRTSQAIEVEIGIEYGEGESGPQ